MRVSNPAAAPSVVNIKLIRQARRDYKYGGEINPNFINGVSDSVRARTMTKEDAKHILAYARERWIKEKQLPDYDEMTKEILEYEYKPEEHTGIIKGIVEEIKVLIDFFRL